MTPSADLHELIHSLTKMEKRYFKLYVTRTSVTKDTLSLKIFDAIAKQKIYDEKALLHKFKNESFASNFPSYKNHLYTIVLRALTHYRESTSINDSIATQLHQVKILMENNLYKQAYKLNQRLRSKAIEIEDFASIVESLELDRKMLIARSGEYLFDAPSDVVINKIMTMSQNILEQWQNVLEIQKIQTMLFDAHLNFIQRFASWEEAELWAENLMRHPCLSPSVRHQSFTEFKIFHYTHFLFETQFRNNFSEGYNHAMIMVKEYENHPKIIKSDGLGYLRACSWMITISIWLYNDTIALEYVHKMRTAPEKYQMVRNADVNRFDLQSYALEGTILTGLFLNESSQKFIPEALKALDRWHDLKRYHEEIQILLSCIQLLYEMDNYQECIALCIRYLNSKEYQKWEELVKTYLSLSHFALGNMEILLSISRGAIRTLQKTPLLLGSHKPFFLCMHRIAEADSDAAIRKHIHSFLLQFTEHNNNQPASQQNRATTSVDYIWAKAYLKGISYSEEARIQNEAAKRNLQSE
jgi:hypothetical protein